MKGYNSVSVGFLLLFFWHMHSGAVSCWQWLPYLTNFQCEAMSAMSYQLKIQSIHLIKVLFNTS